MGSRGVASKSNIVSSREKKGKRREIMEKKKAIDELIKAASSEKDHLVYFQPFCHYNRNGLSVFLKSGCGDKLCSSVKQYIQNLLKVNMEVLFGPEWSTEEKVKYREMVASEARYIFIHEAPNASVDEMSMNLDKSPLVGFVHYRFTLEEEIPVLYVYEIQLESRVQGKGLGKFLMQLIELIAHKSHMGAVVLTVQKANAVAMSFYTSKLRYTISSISPSRVDSLMGLEKSYEILCKAFDHEAKAILEVIGISKKYSTLAIQELGECMISTQTASIKRTSKSAVKISRTGLWSDNLDSPLLYCICFSPSPKQIIRSHLQKHLS